MRRTTALFAVIALALVAAGAAGAIGVGRVFTVKRGDRADFTTKPSWSCFNAGTVVRCQSGDALPYAEILSSRHGGVTVKVHTLTSGGMRTRAVTHPAFQELKPYTEVVYEFSAF
jgi:hypothetical protein